MRTPGFDNLRRVLDRARPSRPTLFEFFLNWDLYVDLAGPAVAGVAEENRDDLHASRVQMHGFLNAGYDYATMMPSGPRHFHFPMHDRHRAQTVSINEADSITDRASFESYGWLDPDACDYSVFERLAPELPKGA